MKTSKQDIQDLLSQLATDIEEIKAILRNGNTMTCSAGKADANADSVCAISQLQQVVESLQSSCENNAKDLKKYQLSLAKDLIKVLFEELTKDEASRKCKGLPTIEDKIDNVLTILSSLIDKLDLLAKAVQPKENSIRKRAATTGIKSIWSGMRQLQLKQPARWHRNPYILCTVVICLLYFGLSVFNWMQWHHYRDENAHLRLSAEKYRVDSLILHEVYPQVAAALSGYEHIIESEGADAALHVFRNKVQESDSNHKSKSKQHYNE